MEISYKDSIRFGNIMQNTEIGFGNDKVKEQEKKKFNFISDFNILNVDQKSDIYKNFLESKVLTIDNYRSEENIYFILCFKQTFIIQSSISEILQIFNSKNKSIVISYMNDTKKILDQNNIQIKNEEIQITHSIDYSFLIQEFQSIKLKNEKLGKIWQIISPCICHNLIDESYERFDENRIKNAIKNQGEINISKDHMFDIGNIDTGSSFHAKLYYNFEKEAIYLSKIPISSENVEKLITREIRNYSKFKHPFIPKFIGTNENYLIIEFINGKTLLEINEMKINLSDEDKFLIIFELLLIFRCIHAKNCIFLDLKPNNVMIDKNKNAILIDFDRTICISDDISESILDFNSEYCAPEASSGHFSYKNDIYSLGKIIKYIMGNSLLKYEKIKNIIKMCTNKDPIKRPKLLELIFIFTFDIYENIQNNKMILEYEEFIKEIYGKEYLNNTHKEMIQYLEKKAKQEDPKALYYLGYFYLKGKYIQKNLKRAINYLELSAKRNNSNAQAALSELYIYSKEIKQDFVKAKEYLDKSVEQNNPKALNLLGELYKEGHYFKCDIKKAVEYFKRASEQNCFEADANLAHLYFEGELIEKDIDKAIYYYTLAADHNYSPALTKLGVIYASRDDINKSIYYFSKAAEQNHLEALEKLGNIYFDDKYNFQNIEKSIHYFELAAEQNSLEANRVLGEIYFRGDLVPKDISKAIYYFAKASDQKNVYAQNQLGHIYFTNEYGVHDIQKAIHYFTLAADNGDLESQLFLGDIYVNSDIGKTIHYTELAASQNEPRAQFNLFTTYIHKYQDYPRAMKYLIMAADNNSPEAQCILGILYNEGKFLKQDVDKSIEYLMRAAKNCLGFQPNINIYNQTDKNKLIDQLEFEALREKPRAKYFLGKLYYEGKFVKQNTDKAIKYLESASDQNEMDAKLYLSCIYLNGLHVKKDITKAIKYLLIPAQLNYIPAINNLGIIYISLNDLERSIYYLEMAADQNYAISQYILGNIYLDGPRGIKNIKKAIYYYTLAAHQNFFYAQKILGKLYYEGILVERNINEAFKYLKECAKHGDGDSLYRLGVIYIDIDFNQSIRCMMLAADNMNQDAQIYMGDLYFLGTHVQKDINKAIYYYELAAKKKNSDALNKLAFIYCKSNVKQYIQKAIYYLTLSANQNDEYAMSNLGSLYLIGKFVKKDTEKAMHYLISAANKNLVDIQRRLGNIFYSGIFVPRDIDKSIYWYKMASDNNDLVSQYWLGKIYLETINKQNIKQNLDKSIKYFTKAANSSYASAQRVLGAMYFEGKYVKQNFQKAFYYLKLSADQNDGIAQYYLAVFYFNGIYIKKDIKKTVQYLISSANRDCLEAQLALAIYYYDGIYIEKNIQNSIDLLQRSYKRCKELLKKGNESCFVLGYIYYEIKEFDKAINFYTEASNFNDQYAKNNLAIIYKNGIGNKIVKNIDKSIFYLGEAIEQKNDKIAMLNLANIYLFENPNLDDIRKAIELLIKLSKQDFLMSKNLLCIALIKSFKMKSKNMKSVIELVREELAIFNEKSEDFMNFLYNLIIINQYFNDYVFEEQVKYYKNIDLIYNHNLEIIPIDHSNPQIMNVNQHKTIQNITNDFYDGFNN